MNDTPTQRRDQSAWTNLRRRKVVQWGLVYAAAAWGFLQGLAYISSTFDWPRHIPQVATLALLIGLPIALVLAWYHGDRGQQRISTLELGILALLLLLGGGVLWYYQHTSEVGKIEAAKMADTAQREGSPALKDAHPSIEAQVMAALPGDDRPAIAVLPFKNLGASADDDYFADGLTEDLINRLGSWRRFPVIGSASSLGYRGDLPSNQVAKELNARYLVRGTVRRSAEAVRIDVGLYDSNSGVQIWNEHYDRPYGDALAVQDAISEAIVGAMYPRLQGFDERRALRRNPKDLTAWDLAQRGAWHSARFTATDNALAIKYFVQAIARDPSFATAEAALSEAHYMNISFGWTDTPEHSIALLVQSAERAVLVDSQNGSSQHALGHAYALTGNREGMIQAFKTSLELDPNSSLGQVCAGEGLALAGESDAAIKVLHRALRLSPRDPEVSWTYHSMALAYFAKENYPESVIWAQRAVSYGPQVAFFHRTLVTSLAHAGRVDEAQAALARATDLEPDFTLGGGRRIMLAGNPQMADRYMSGLRIAGLK